MSSALIFTALVGSVMLVVAMGLILPELAIDSPLELLISLVSLRGRSVFTLAHEHIQEGWPETRVAGFLYYGGLLCLGGAISVFMLREFLAEN